MAISSLWKSNPPAKLEEIDELWEQAFGARYEGQQADALKAAMRSQAAAAQQVQNYNYSQATQAQQQIPLQANIHLRALRLLKTRLNGLDNDYPLTKDETILTHVYQEKVYVFFVIKGRAGYFEDELALFPSDGLITKFRMIH